jgi:hypothetical protein
MNWTVLLKSAWRWLWPVLKREGADIAIETGKVIVQKKLGGQKTPPPEGA